MRTVYKYQLRDNPLEFDLHAGAKIVHFAAQGDHLCLWVEVDTTQPKVRVEFEVFGTGHRIPDDVSHIATCIDDSFVWHLYRRS